MDLTTVVGVVAVGFVALTLGMQVFLRLRSRALIGSPVPPLPGTVGAAVGRSKRALLYFFSPSCAACRYITPTVKELQRHDPTVFPIDVSEDFTVAGALKVMATPTTIEIADGKIVGYHVGLFPPELASRFGAPHPA